MINLPIAELATPASETATAATQQSESVTSASVEFQAVLEDTPEPGIARLPKTDAGDAVAMGVGDLLFADTGDRQTEASGSASIIYKLIAAGSSEGQETPDQTPNTMFGHMQGVFETIQGLPDGVPDDLPAQTELESDPIVEQPPEAEAQTDIPYRFELPETSQSKDSPINRFNKTGLNENRMVGDDGVKPNKSRETLPLTAKNDAGQPTAHLSAESLTQIKVPTDSAPLDGVGDPLKPLIMQQQNSRPEDTGLPPRPRMDSAAFVDQTQPMKSLDTGQDLNTRMVPASDGTLVPHAGSERVTKEQKGAITPKQPEMSLREIGASQESPKPLPSTGARDQVSPAQTQTGQPKGGQPDPVLTDAAVLPENAAKTQPVAASDWAGAKVATPPVTAPVAKSNAPVAKSAESETPRRLLQENPQIPPARAPETNQQVIQPPPVNTPVTLVEPDETGLFEIRNTGDSAGIMTTSAHAPGQIPSQHNPLLAAPEIPRHVARQLADAARQMPERPVELTLNPAELGRVRLTFTLTDGGINVAVLAERGETMDLMRRHIETLAQEFRGLGYADVGFQFSQNGQGGADQDSANAQTRPSTVQATMPEIETTIPAKVSLEPSSGLDLRL